MYEESTDRTSSQCAYYSKAAHSHQYVNGSKDCVILTRVRPIACIKQDGKAPVAKELFTVEMTLGPTISETP